MESPPLDIATEPQDGTTATALRGVARLLSETLEAAGPDAARAAVAAEAHALFDASVVVIASIGRDERSIEPVIREPDTGTPWHTLSLEDCPELIDLAGGRSRSAVLEGMQLRSAERLGAVDCERVLALPLRSRSGIRELLLVGRSERPFEQEEIEAGSVFADAAGSRLGELRDAQQVAAQHAQQGALVRAAEALNEDLNVPRLLSAIGREAAAVLGAELAAVWVGDEEQGVRMEAIHGFPEDVIGYRMPPGSGVAGRVAQTGRSMVVNDYRSIAPPDSPFGRVECCIGVPLHRKGKLHGVLAVGYERQYVAGETELLLLESFSQLADVALRNASEQAGLARAARTDSLTGCLNHATLHEVLHQEIERCERTGSLLSFALIDLDDFKLVNERHGHPAGDEVLRRVGQAIEQAARTYDQVARYGGDEFALVLADAAEHEAADVTRRALERLAGSVAGLELESEPAATAGVAEWEPGMSASELVARADEALLGGKRSGYRGNAAVASEMDGSATAVVRALRPAEPSAAAPLRPVETPAPAGNREQVERLRKRTRQLALANALGMRIAAIDTPDQLLDAAVEELQRAFGYYMCAIARIREDGYVELVAGRGKPFERLGDRKISQPLEAGVIGRALRERRPIVVNDVMLDADYRSVEESSESRAELTVPLWVGGELWGAINVEQDQPDAFDEDDLRLLTTIADQVGLALRSTTLYEQLERAYLGTAEALAAALEAKDFATASHSQSLVRRVEGVGAKLGMTERELRVVRYGAVFHDIGKIAIPEAILNKPGPLSEEEWVVMERHTIVGEQILAPVEFLREVLPVVRHEHERWDGGGYPDGLKGEQIPLGSRVILVCDAYDAMTSDRSYRRGMPHEQAIAELRSNAGTQFDPQAVEALLDVLEVERAAGAD
ncbi:MAG TPA: GAF domain-containing protein [Thermoleophilaceae bacterium]